MSSRDKAECAYCGAEMRRDNLHRHTTRKHVGLPVREKGWKDIASMLPSSTKRLRLDALEEDAGFVKENVNESEAVEVTDLGDSNSKSSSASVPSTSSVITTPSVPTGLCFQSSGSSQEVSQKKVSGEGDKEYRKEPAESGEGGHFTTNQSTTHVTATPLLDRTLPFPSDPANFTESNDTRTL